VLGLPRRQPCRANGPHARQSVSTATHHRRRANSDGSPRPPPCSRPFPQGAAPSPRAESAAAFLSGQGLLILQGGSALGPQRRLLADAHCLDLSRRPPAWSRLQPLPAGRGAAPQAPLAAPPPQQQGAAAAVGPLLAVAGHAGAALGDRAVFVGGCQRLDRLEPGGWLQVLERAVVPPSPDAAGASEEAKARQHCRQQLARMLRRDGAGHQVRGRGAAAWRLGT
jgi:hypothetical protein